MKHFLYCTLVLLLFAVTSLAQNKELNKLADAAAKASKKDLFSTADSLYYEYVKLFREQQLEKNYQYSEILIYLARRAAKKGRIDEAITLQREVVEVRSTAQDCTFTQWASAISDLASFYSQKGNYTQAIETGQEAMGMLKRKLGANHQFYNIALANQASFYAARGQEGDYQMATSLGEAAVKNLKKGTQEYASALNALVVYYTQAGDLYNASKISAKAIEEAKKHLEEDGIGYAAVFNSQAIQLAKLGNYEDAIEYERMARFGFEISGVRNLPYGKILNNLATFLNHQQQYEEAIELLEQARTVIEKAVGKNHPDYLRCMGDLSTTYRISGNLEKADELANESSAVSQSLNSSENIKYAKSLSNQAAVFASNGNYLRAIEHEQKAYNIFKNRNDKFNMAQSLGHLATFLSNDGRREQAFETAKKGLDIFASQKDTSVYYAQALNNTAILYFNAEQYQMATIYGEKARRIYEQLGDTATAIFARILANNALFAFVNDRLDEAVATAQQALELQTRILRDDHPDHVPLLYNLAVYESKAGLKKEAEQHYSLAMKLQSNQVRTDFLHLTSQEREKFWNRKSYIFRYAPMLAYQDPDNQAMATMAYNALLFSKGILLNSDIDFRNLIKATNNQILLNKYNRLEELQKQLEGYYRLPAEKRDIDIDQIQREIYDLERVLVRDCKEYGNFTKNLNIDTKGISESLHDDEIAIEFAETHINGRGTTYLAFLLKKGQPEPKMMRLFSDDELSEIKYDNLDFLRAVQIQSGIDSIYTDKRFGQMLWQPLMKEMAGIKKIYFSPTSLFYQLGIEYLPCDSVHRINDLYEVYRVSSTKQLAMRGDAKFAITSATVYGGLNYDMDVSELQEQKTNHSTGNLDNLLAMADVDMSRAIDSLTLRGSVGYLPGTLHEAESVGEQLMQNDIATTMLLGNEGTEETFKALSGHNISILHIATHGFYFSEQELKRRNRRLLFLNEQTDNLGNPLNYSGILLSGANYVLKGGKLPNDLEDGILTANEIAQLDLSNTDMVVLSACQTGVGEIRDDGVFGIQRGFKKAGVNSLLMSLWSVSDEATDMMMTLFYQNLIAGQSKREAFQNAQKALQDNRFSAPFFWASFILLDGF